MTTKYWVGNGGNWYDTAHWSLSSGGSGGAGVPSYEDDVIFDSGSFSLPAQTVRVLGSAAKTVDFTSVTNQPTLFFDLSSSGFLQLRHGYSTFLAVQGMSITGKPRLYIQGACTLNSGGHVFYSIHLSDNFLFLLDSDLAVTSLTLSYGVFDTGGYNIVADRFSSLQMSLGQGFYFRDSVIAVKDFDISYAYETSVIRDFGTSELVISRTVYFYSECIYYNIKIFNALTASLYGSGYRTITCNNFTIADCELVEISDLNISINGLLTIAGSLSTQQTVRTVYGTGNFTQISSESVNASYTTFEGVCVGTLIDLCTVGTATALDSYSESYSPSMAFDDDINTDWYSNIVPNWLKYDFGLGNAKIVTAYTIRCYNRGYLISDWTFEGSNDDSNWTTLNTVTGQTSVSTRGYTFTNTTAYRYYRINITSITEGLDPDIVEVTMYESQYDNLVNYYALLSSGNIDGGGNIGWIFEELIILSITSFSPSSGYISDEITITGTGFIDITSVKIGDIDCEIKSYDSTEIVFYINHEAITDLISVSTESETVYSETPLIINQPTITLQDNLTCENLIVTHSFYSQEYKINSRGVLLNPLTSETIINIDNSDISCLIFQIDDANDYLQNNLLSNITIEEQL